MDYKEHIDYDLVESTNPAFGKAVVRVNVFRNHRQAWHPTRKNPHACPCLFLLVIVFHPMRSFCQCYGSTFLSS